MNIQWWQKYSMNFVGDLNGDKAEQGKIQPKNIPPSKSIFTFNRYSFSYKYLREV